MDNRANGEWQVEYPPPAIHISGMGSGHYASRERKNIMIAIALLVVAFVTCILAGYSWDVQYRYALTGQMDYPAEFFRDPWIVLRGVPYALAILFILLCHEMGHFLACRYHRLYSTPPFPLPFPAPVPFIPFLSDFLSFGTLGAFIKIKEPFRDRRQLFDIGIMGPLAGMVAAIPVFVIGLSLSHYSSLQPQGLTLVFGDSLMTWLGFHSFFPGGSDLVALHPLGWAAYFGFLATSLNLLPIGQLDGGHIVYAIFGPRGHRIISRVFFVLLIAVSLLSFPSYLVFALVLLFIRLKHPPTIHDEIKIRGYRRILAIVAFIIFCLTFIPIPFQIKQF